MNTPANQDPQKPEPHYRRQHTTFREEKLAPPIESFDNNSSLWVVVAIIVTTFLLIALTPQIGVLAGAAVGMVIFSVWVLYKYISRQERSRTEKSRTEDE